MIAEDRMDRKTEAAPHPDHAGKLFRLLRRVPGRLDVVPEGDGKIRPRLPEPCESPFKIREGAAAVSPLRQARQIGMQVGEQTEPHDRVHQRISPFR